jgi:hypothetical protein
MPIAPEHQPYFHGPHINVPKKAHPPLPSLPAPDQASHKIGILCGLQHLSNWPVSFGSTATPVVRNATHWCLYNSDITRAAGMLARFMWGVYGFNSGHFLTLIQEQALPFKIVLACNSYVNGRALFCKMMDCPTILNSASALYDHVRGSGITSRLFGSIIHLHKYSSTEPTSQFLGHPTQYCLETAHHSFIGNCVSVCPSQPRLSLSFYCFYKTAIRRRMDDHRYIYCLS